MKNKPTLRSPWGFLFLIFVAGLFLILTYQFIAVPLAKWSTQNSYVIMGLIFLLFSVPFMIFKSKPKNMTSQKNNKIASIAIVIILFVTGIYLAWPFMQNAFTAAIQELAQLKTVLIIVLATIVAIVVAYLIWKASKNKTKIGNLSNNGDNNNSGTTTRVKIPREIERQVLSRANNRCQWKFCKVTGNLQIHHIDRNPANNSLSNLIYLCHNCHYQKAHRNEARDWQLRDWAQGRY